MATNEGIDRIVQESVIGTHLHDGEYVGGGEEFFEYLVETTKW
jgi:hypothetical protein